MTSNPQCKINLGLNVVSRRPDGYHDLETVFLPVALCDSLTIEEAPELAQPYEFTTNESFGLPDEKNLVIKALMLLRADHDLPPVRIHLEKVIPSGAGLGGGSSDAAALLVAVNKMFALGESDEMLESRAATLGADCAFFVRSQPSFATGIGDKLSPITVDLQGHSMVIVKPRVSVSTAAAYSHVVPRRPKENILDILARPVDEWKHSLVNDFEASVFPQFPAIEEVKERLYSLGATYASMSGSGASVFALFKHVPEGLDTLFADCFVWSER